MLGPVLLVGCGRMGGALAQAWLKAAPGLDLRIVNPHPVMFDCPQYRTADEIPAGFSPRLVVIAIKPQQAPAALPGYRRFAQATFLSIMAGQTLAGLEARLGPVALVRAMPNTPARIGCGISVLVANARVRPDGRDEAAAALGTCGEIEWVTDEVQLDAVTALSGSGPAYVFHLVEVLAEAGKKLGLSPDLALTLARQTLIGSACLLEQSNASAADLRAEVTSPNGTTAAALAILQDGRLQRLYDEALQSAAHRSRELAG